MVNLHRVGSFALITTHRLAHRLEFDRSPEVRKLNLALSVDEDICTLQITVDYVHGVQVLEPFHDLYCVFAHQGFIELAEPVENLPD